MLDFSPFFIHKKILITGGCGFIGSNLARKLSDLGAEVTVIDSLIPDYGGNLFNLHGYEKLIKVNISDVRDQYSINRLIQGQDILFNLAGQVSHIDSMQNPFPDEEINVHSQLSILEACRKQNPLIRIIFASTRQIYGKPDYLPVDENHSLKPVDINGINKIAGESYHMLYGNIYHIPITSLRLTNVFGPRMRIKDSRQTFIGWWIRQAIEGQNIQVYGDGKQIRDINYVDDVVEALLLCATFNTTIGEIYNLGGMPISLNDLANIFTQVRRDVAFELMPFPDDRKIIDIGSFYGNFSKFHNATGWQPRVSYLDGIQQTLHYYSINYQKYI